MNWRIRLANWLVRPLGMRLGWRNHQWGVFYDFGGRTAADILAAKRKPTVDNTDTTPNPKEQP